MEFSRVGRAVSSYANQDGSNAGQHRKLGGTVKVFGDVTHLLGAARKSSCRL